MPDHPLTIGAILFPGFELLDVFGPVELFGLLGDRVRLVTLAEQPGPVASSLGPAAVAELRLADPAPLDVLLVPGGIGTRREAANPDFLALLRARAADSRFVASVCTGSGLLAKAGLLDGLRATSNKIAFDWAVSQGPRVQWVRAARWVEDGKFFTSSGVSAGMDMTLGMIQRFFGRAVSLQIARRAEYQWQEDPTLDPFAAGPAN